MSSEAPRVRVGVGVFVLSSSSQQVPETPRFLIGKRINAHGTGTWALPGGHLEYGETFEDCATREVLEETGLKITNTRFLTATNDYMPGDNKHYVTIFMCGEREDDRDRPEVLEPDKCEGWEWACWDDLLRWARQEDDAQGGADIVVERRLFTPLLDLVRQRSGKELVSGLCPPTI